MVHMVVTAVMAATAVTEVTVSVVDTAGCGMALPIMIVAVV